MKTFAYAVSVTATLLLFTSSDAHAASMESFEARIGLGTSADSQGFAGFFETGFVQGSPSHTDTISFDDGVVKVDFDVTVEGFEESGGPGGLRTTSAAVGVDGSGDTGSETTRIDAGEAIKVTFNDISFSIIGAPPAGMIVDPGSFEALISSIRFAAFDNGTDTYSYSGVGAGSVVGDDTSTLSFVPNQTIATGDMFTITGDSGEFRGLYISMSGNYETVIPEPATLSLVALSLVGIALKRRS
ncbi:MAG: PEP-CTERM sorting domain-containing protein [Planctomycetota bacterium]